jgi:hypothetical protein
MVRTVITRSERCIFAYLPCAFDFELPLSCEAQFGYDFARAATIYYDAQRAQDFADIEDQSDLSLFNGKQETLIVRVGLVKKPKGSRAASRVSQVSDMTVGGSTATPN